MRLRQVRAGAWLRRPVGRRGPFRRPASIAADVEGEVGVVDLLEVIDVEYERSTLTVLDLLPIMNISCDLKTENGLWKSYFT